MPPWPRVRPPCRKRLCSMSSRTSDGRSRQANSSRSWAPEPNTLLESTKERRRRPRLSVAALCSEKGAAMRIKFFAIASISLGPLFGQCDRACLEPFVDKYLDAMPAHDPSKAPFAKGVKFTENGQRLELGDGLWNTMTAKGVFRLFVTDIEAQQVAFLGSIKEAGKGAMIGLRLRIRNNRITEAEHFVQRSPTSAAGFERIGYQWTEAVPPAERMSREELVRVANMYFSGMQKNDGTGDYPFAEDCNRIENGALSTNQPAKQGQQRPDPKTATMYSGEWSCMEQFKSGLIHFVTRIRDRRYVAV